MMMTGSKKGDEEPIVGFESSEQVLSLLTV